MFTSLSKGMIKGTDEQPDEEIHSVRSGRVLHTGPFVPMELGRVTLPVWMCSPAWKLSNSILLGSYRPLFMQA